MKYRIAITLFAVIIIGFLVLPDLAQAWSWGQPLVPCGTRVNPQPCNRCELFHLLKNLMDFILKAIVPIAGTLMIIVAGVFFILGAANPALLSRGKTIFSATLTAIIVIALAWLITNTILSQLGDNVATNWYSFQCTAPTIPVYSPPPTTSVVPTPDTCDPKLLAQQHNNALYPSGNSKEVNDMVQCVKNKVPGVNLGEVSSADKKYDLCNYTRGRVLPQCGMYRCGHSVNSCHYGGTSGTQGALAVDFGMDPGKGAAEKQYGDAVVKAAYECGAKGGGARCEGPVNGVVKTVACTSGLADHVHITTASCDRN